MAVAHGVRCLGAMLGKNGLNLSFNILAAMPHQITATGFCAIDQVRQVSGELIGLLKRGHSRRSEGNFLMRKPILPPNHPANRLFKTVLQ